MVSASQTIARDGGPDGVRRAPAARLAFRPEIEGLRAVAIMPVVLVHAGFTQFPGGFVGVDVFFVISGYLITRIIMADMEQDRFSLARFYARRFARLGPTLWVMLASVLLAGLWLLLPSDWPDLTSETISAAGFAANLYYWATTDYFATHETALLLHTWSLGVEEQFYLFYPIALVALRRWLPGREVAALTVVAVVSFALCLWLSQTAPQAAFYLFSSRAWEMALGGLVAVGAGFRITLAPLRATLALAGLAMIAIAVLGVDRFGAFPAPAALLPCIGTALIIDYGSSGPARMLLSLAPARWIGRISYSTYLWHWPIIVFWRLEHGVLQDRWSRVGLVVAALAAGAASYYLIEKRGQRTLHRLSSRTVFRIGIASVAGVSALAAGGLALAPYVVSGPAAQMAVTLASRADERRATQFRMGTCFGNELDFERCVQPAGDGRDVVVMGSSYAAMLWDALAKANPERRVHQATVLGCNPVVESEGPAPCVEVYARVFNLARAGKIAHVVLASRWYAEDAPAVAATVRAMRDAGVQVTVIGPPVEYEQSFPRVLAIAERRGDPAFVAAMRRSERDAIDPVLRSAVHQAGGRYVSQLALECPERTCRHLASDGLPIHYDTGHLTPQAARDLAAAIGPL